MIIITLDAIPCHDNPTPYSSFRSRSSSYLPSSPCPNTEPDRIKKINHIDKKNNQTFRPLHVIHNFPPCQFLLSLPRLDSSLFTPTIFPPYGLCLLRGSLFSFFFFFLPESIFFLPMSRILPQICNVCLQGERKSLVLYNHVFEP